MNFSQAIASGYKNYVTFAGRATRPEYWYWVLYQFLGLVVLEILSVSSSFFGTLAFLFALVNFLPGLALGVRRLRDAGYSPFLLLLSIIPFLGLVVLIFLCMPTKPLVNVATSPAAGRFCSTCGSPQFGGVFCPNCGTSAQ